MTHASMLEEKRVDRDLGGLVLLDLPDHDSTEISHHVEMERLVELADLLVWVLDPQSTPTPRCTIASCVPWSSTVAR